MPTSAPTDPAQAAAGRRAQALASATQAPWLHGEVGRRMAERLDVLRRPPARWVDWSAAHGGAGAAVRERFPQAQRRLVEPQPALLQRSRAALPPPPRRRWPWSPVADPPPPVLLEAEVEPGQADLVWANMALPLAADPAGLLDRWQRALAPEGLLMFSTFGPDSFRELRALHDALGAGPAHRPYLDMHDWGDLLVQRGWADPVMDQDVLTLTWSSPDACLDELRSWGGNVDPERFPGLRTPRWRQRWLEGLAALRSPAHDGRIPLTLEIVHGHAWRGQPRSDAEGRTEVPLDQMRQMLRQRRR